MQLPEGFYGRIAPRSGLALAHHIHICGGVIDQDYRGNIGVIIYKHSEILFLVFQGDRIAQLICGKICFPILEE
jgi:dUTP pyrophosphatase